MSKSPPSQQAGGFFEFTQTWAKFGPAALEKMTGLTAAHQRVWRRRHHLAPVNGGRAEFDTFEAAAIAIRYQLVQRGLSPAESLALGGEYAGVAVYQAIANGDGAVEVFGPTEEAVNGFKTEYNRDLAIAMKISGIAKEDPGCFLLGFSDGPPKLVPDLDLLADDSRRFSGYFLNLERIGQRLSENARIPLVSVSLMGAEETGPPGQIRTLLVKSQTSQQTRSSN